MHILLMIAGVLGAAAFWYHRAKDVGTAASEAVDTAQRARGAWNRRKFRRKADESAITAITDPAIAAAVMMISVCQERGPLSPGTQNAIKAEIRRITGSADPMEIFVFANWAADHAASPNDISLKLSKLWADRLTIDERRDFATMVARVAGIEGDLLPIQTSVIGKLRERLAIA